MDSLEVRSETTASKAVLDVGLSVYHADSESPSVKDSCAWVSEQRAELNQTLLREGALLLRGFGASNASRFEKIISSFQSSFLDYVDGNSPRTRLSSNVYTSTEFPPEYTISMHNEMSYSHVWPKQLYFGCQIAPKAAGNTLIADCRAVLKAMDSEIVDAFRAKKISYRRFLHDGHGVGPSWMSTFESNDKIKVADYCEQNRIDYEWSGNDLHLEQTVDGIIQHPITGEEVWFSQADQFHPLNFPPKMAQEISALAKGDVRKFPTYATFGNGEEIPPDMFSRIREVFEENIMVFEWQKGDLLIIDNVLMAHGRAPFSGLRKIMVAMS